MPEVIPCPVCDAPMNRHAEKLVPPGDEDAAHEGVLFSFHECPRCGWIEQRAEGAV